MLSRSFRCCFNDNHLGTSSLSQMPRGRRPHHQGRISIGQFGNFVPQLGDGQAILFREEVLDRNGERRDVQLKGAGRTPFSRARRRPRRPSEYRGLSWGNVADGEISVRQRADTLGRD
jgi:hypothetical protein